MIDDGHRKMFLEINRKRRDMSESSRRSLSPGESPHGCQTQTGPVVDGASGMGDPYYPRMGNGGTDEFIALAKEVSGQDLKGGH